ncbi:MAG TPA: peptidoglycan DD-metalloendopeptidase family protein, partial [Myxococcales bacterium]|nr:peptidoglycan DD-metalloendopeptidase family protein [Myxococcales bacterium]
RSQLDKSYTILLVPDRDAKVKKIRVEHRVLVRAVLCLGLVLAAFAGAMAHYFNVVGKLAENKVLRDENRELQDRWREAELKFQHINDELDRVKRLNANLRHITQLNDPDRKLSIASPEQSRGGPGPEFVGGGIATEPAQAGMGAVGMAKPGMSGEGQMIADGDSAPAQEQGDLLKQLDELGKKVKAQEQEARALKSYFEDQQALLASAPSIWPVKGWVTSDFSVRLDPYTGERVMHEGLDIATAMGTPVRAPADGTVVFAGLEGGYGHVLVLDHGYGIKTRYGHLSRTDVKVGQRVHRGDIIAAVGNSGRSTGPHVHYEVRVNGVADNPRKFILEE